MNVVENIRYNVPLTLFCLLIILSGCNFREVLDDYPVSGVQITLDWTGVAENLPKTVRVVFYPKDAEGRKVDGYLPAAGGEMKVPPGNYAMIVYNYNTECVCIEGDECYGTIRAYTERCIGIDAGEDMIWSPDDFYVVALDDVEIAKSEAVMVMKLKPERVVSSYSFAVKVDGVENISAVVCYVSGLNGGYFLSRRLCTLAEVPVYVENDCKNGLLQGHFSHFRLPKSADTRGDSPVVLTIRIIKVDKQVQEIQVDIKELITPPTSGEEEEIQPAPDGEIHIEVPVPDGQITVEVDKEEGGNSGIGGDIGDWDDETNVDIIV